MPVDGPQAAEGKNGGEGSVSSSAAGGAASRERKPLPEWLRVRAPQAERIRMMEGMLSDLGLNTVCESAICPNRGECFERGTATFMILGAVCTRNCRFCAVEHGRPAAFDPEEPRRVARAVSRMGLRHVVITSVTRDDLSDGGAGQFARTIECIRKLDPSIAVEVLVPDFAGSQAALARVLRAGPDILNHNLETVPRLYSRVRPEADYARSLALLKQAANSGRVEYTKSGLMLGLGETREEVVEVMEHLLAHGCDMLTLGQYLRPSPYHLPVHTYIHPDQFAAYGERAAELGFRHVASAPLVRSSFQAERALDEIAGGERSGGHGGARAEE